MVGRVDVVGICAALCTIAIGLQGCGESEDIETELMRKKWITSSAAKGYTVHEGATGCYVANKAPNVNAKFGLAPAAEYCSLVEHPSADKFFGMDLCALKALHECDAEKLCKGFVWNHVTRQVDMYDDSYFDPQLCGTPEGFAYAMWSATSQPELFVKKAAVPAMNITPSTLPVEDHIASVTVSLGDYTTQGAENTCGQIILEYSSGAQLRLGKAGGKEQPPWVIPKGEYLTTVNVRSNLPDDYVPQSNSTSSIETSAVAVPQSNSTSSTWTSTDNGNESTQPTSPQVYTLYGCSFQTSAGSISPWYGSGNGTLKAFVASSNHQILAMNTTYDSSVPFAIVETAIDTDCINGWQANASCVSGSWSYNGKTYMGCTTEGDVLGWCPSCTNYSQGDPNCRFHYCASCSGMCTNGWLPKPKCVPNWDYDGTHQTGCTLKNAMNGQAWCSNCSFYDENLPDCDWSYCSQCVQATTSTTTTIMNSSQLEAYQAEAAAAFAAGRPPPGVPGPAPAPPQALYDAVPLRLQATVLHPGLLLAAFAVGLLVAAAAGIVRTRGAPYSETVLLLHGNEEEGLHASQFLVAE